MKTTTDHHYFGPSGGKRKKWCWKGHLLYRLHTHTHTQIIDNNCLEMKNRNLCVFYHHHHSSHTKLKIYIAINQDDHL